jgi:hypothetical protein
VTHHTAITQEDAEEEGSWRNKTQGDGKDGNVSVVMRMWCEKEADRRFGVALETLIDLVDYFRRSGG